MKRSTVFFISVLFIFSQINSACQEIRDTENRPSIDVIKAHLDSNVRVFGSYAVVKLPVESGVQVWNPVQIVRGPDGLMYVANNTGEIYTLHDTTGDGLENHAELFCNVSNDGLRTPASIVFNGNDLYVGTAQEIRIYTDLNGDGRADTSRTFFDDIPQSEHPYEWASALTFGPDGYLYFVLTTDSWNAGAAPDPRGWRGAMLRISPDGSEVKRFATGLRSVHSMVLNEYDELIFHDNEGGGNPTEELHIARRGHFYGHNPAKYGNPEADIPIHHLQTEVAPAGMEFNPADNDFGGTAGDLFVSFYGPGERWNRGAIARLKLEKQEDGSYQTEEIPVALDFPKLSDLAFGPNGDLYVTRVGRTDYWYQALDEPDGAIYRLMYAPWVEPHSLDEAFVTTENVVDVDILEQGKELFTMRACDACHAVDGITEMLGPNLADIGSRFSRDELYEKIQNPSERITPGMMATRITKTDDEILIGRIINADEDQVRMIIVGNRILEIPRVEIRNQEPFPESLMFEGLLTGLSDEDVDAILTYLMSLRLIPGN